LDERNPLVNEAYTEKLREFGASHMLEDAIEPRAMAGTFESTLSQARVG
jgi:hypothetical protein